MCFGLAHNVELRTDSTYHMYATAVSRKLPDIVTTDKHIAESVNYCQCHVHKNSSIPIKPSIPSLLFCPENIHPHICMICWLARLKNEQKTYWPRQRKEYDCVWKQLLFEILKKQRADFYHYAVPPPIKKSIVDKRLLLWKHLPTLYFQLFWF